MFLVDEFGEEEIGDDRVGLCELLEEWCNVRDAGKAVLPMDIGLRVKLPELSMFCQRSNQFVPFGEIMARLPAEGGGLVYERRGAGMV